MQVGNQKELAAGALFIGVGATFVIYTLLTLRIGTPQNMGAGFFPIVLGSLLVILGAVVVVLGQRSRQEPGGAVPWKGIGLLTLSVCAFGATVEGLGLAPAIFIASLLAAMATGKTRLGSALLLSGAVTAFCLLVFVVGLSLPYPVIGSWLGGS